MMNLPVKIVIIGDSYVGKSSILSSFLGDGSKHLKNYFMTNGVEVLEKQVKIPDTNVTVHLFFLDCSGKEFYRPLVKKMQCESPDLLLLVYDVTSEESLHVAENLYGELLVQSGILSVRGVLFGNKTDLSNRRRVSPKIAKDLADRLKLFYLEGSAKEQTGIETPFYLLANEYYKINKDKSDIIDKIKDEE